jgi:hypothetical protein
MQERAFANPKIKFRWNSEVTEILGDKKITGLRLRDTVTGEESTLEVGGLFVAIGARPAQRVVHRAAGHRRRRLPAGRPALHADGHPRRVRLWRRGRPDVSPGRDGRGHRVCRGA